MWYLIVSIPDFCTLTYLDWFVEQHIKEQRDLPVHLKCVLIVSNCEIKLMNLALYFRDFTTQTKYDVGIGNRQLSVCQGYFTLIYEGHLESS